MIWNNKINGTQASKQLKLSVRQTKRLKARIKKEGIEGIIHKNRGKESNRKLDKKLKNKITKIVKENYSDFSSQLTYEKLNEVHNITVSYFSTRRIRISEGLSVVKKESRSSIFHKEKEKSIMEN